MEAMEAMQAYNAISPPQVIIALPAVLPPSSVLSQSPISDSQDFFPSEEISPKDTETSVSPSSSVGSSSPIRSTISPLDYPFDESIFTKLDNSLWITPRPLGEEQSPRNQMSQIFIFGNNYKRISKFVIKGILNKIQELKNNKGKPPY
uniref:Uncharacterized protein n=1 Tax=Tanacetum cinerariifolium TaxID=118510 RepID=A0A699H4R9_TANCI|nr:hypothetical protein [Tanacetum cinerariifolium]